MIGEAISPQQAANTQPVRLGLRIDRVIAAAIALMGIPAVEMIVTPPSG